MPDKTKIFISRKDEDWQIAEQIREKLALYGGERLELYTANDIPAGADWFNWIRTRLVDTDLVILLFVDPSSTWDWCLYEVGLFTPLSETERGAVICFHAPRARPPAPLRHLQAVPGEEKKMRGFLKTFFGTTDIPGVDSIINKAFSQNEEEISALSTFVCEQIRPKTPNVVYHNRFLNITVDPTRLQPTKIPADCEVVSDRISLEIFDLQETPPDPGGDTWKWGDIEQWASTNGDSAWIEEVAQSVYWATQGKVQRPLAATFTSQTTGRTYLPNVNRRETHASGLMTLQILLVHQQNK